MVFSRHDTRQGFYHMGCTLRVWVDIQKLRGGTAFYRIIQLHEPRGRGYTQVVKLIRT
jgi:hypothetical protein